MSGTLDQLVLEVNAAPPARKLKGMLERTALPADIKKILYDLADLTVQVAGKVLAIGRRILAFALDLLRAFPGMAVGIIVAYVMGSLVTSIPIFGGPLSKLLTPLLMLMGIGMGALMDMGSPNFRQRVDRLIDSFGALVGA